MHTSCLLSLEVGEGEEAGPQGAVGVELQEEVEPWRDFPWEEGAGQQSLLLAGVVAMEASYPWLG